MNRAYSAPFSFQTIEQLFLPGKDLPLDTIRLSKPFEIHPALFVLLAVIFVTLILGLWGGALFPIFTTVIGLVLVWTAAVFLILYALVWLARTAYKRHNIPSEALTVSLFI